MRTNFWLIVALAGSTIVGTITGAVAVSRDSNEVVHPEPHAKGEVPPPPFNRWVDPVSGRFAIPEFDDRELSAELKQKYPLRDPRWRPFSECMSGSGFSLGVPAEVDKVAMSDLLVDINAMTTPSGNKQLNNGDVLPGLPGAFLKCADEWLAIPVQDFAIHGLVIEFPVIPSSP